jgi:hypothetical protein
MIASASSSPAFSEHAPGERDLQRGRGDVPPGNGEARSSASGRPQSPVRYQRLRAATVARESDPTPAGTDQAWQQGRTAAFRHAPSRRNGKEKLADSAAIRRGGYAWHRYRPQVR